MTWPRAPPVVAAPKPTGDVSAGTPLVFRVAVAAATWVTSVLVSVGRSGGWVSTAVAGVAPVTVRVMVRARVAREASPSRAGRSEVPMGMMSRLSGGGSGSRGSTRPGGRPGHDLGPYGEYVLG